MDWVTNLAEGLECDRAAPAELSLEPKLWQCTFLPDLDDLRRRATDRACPELDRADALWLVRVHYPETNDYNLILVAAEFVRDRHCEETTQRACLFLEGVQELIAIDALAACYRQEHWACVLDAAERALRAVEDWPAARDALEHRWTPTPDPSRNEATDN
ncbi:MAG: hypothetical protein FD180_3595 [Planctomycetota bacterium]|nr:MAG: hypothetical protein FD180_3595 [Planctomycetota bacterium]